jgi:hypothetical protein
MTSQEFVLWLKGFTEGVHEFNVSPKQWETLKERLAQVTDKVTPVGIGGVGITSGNTVYAGEFTKQLLKDNYNYTLKQTDGKSK